MSLAPVSTFETEQRSTRTFPCPVCPKQFKRRENLSRHSKTHNKVKSHKCPICGREFTRSDLRQRHEAIHAKGATRKRSLRARRDGKTSNGGVANVAHSLASTESITDSHDASVNLVIPTVGLVANATNQSSGLVGSTSTASNEGHLNNNGAPKPSFSVEQQGDDGDTFFPTTSHIDTLSSWIDDRLSTTNNWFDQDFFSVLADTSSFDFDAESLFWPSFPGAPGFSQFDESNLPEPIVPDSHTFAQTLDPSGHGRLSRFSSPPNEASEEDKWPYTWNPRSNGRLTANAILIPDNHPLLINHDNKYDISTSRYDKVRLFLKRPINLGLGIPSVEMPSLVVANAFIGLFFTYFEPRMPVIHLPTFNSADAIPDGLIAIMIVIGAIYSGANHTRRFAIVLLDLTRLSVQLTLEADNALMRDTFMIYACALITYSGLWCGNKRAFELSEVLRGAVVTYCRRNHFAGRSPSAIADRQGDHAAYDAQQAWTAWVVIEQRKRLCWVVYGLDCQFPSLLHLPATISLGELALIECPCDEEFWQASSARKWKRLLGPASVPPSKTFRSAISPIMGPLRSDFDKVLTSPNPTSHSISSSPPLELNAWTRFLVLNVLHVHIYEFSQHIIVAREASIEDSDDEDVNTEAAQLSVVSGDLESIYEATNELMSRCGKIPGSGSSFEHKIFRTLAERKIHLDDALSLFEKTYLSSLPPNAFVYPTTRQFDRSSRTLYRLGVLVLNVCLQDLQDSLGKSGATGIPMAMSSLSMASNNHLKKTQQLFEHAIDLVDTLTMTTSGVGIDQQDYGPEETISLFLSYVYLWNCTNIANPALRTLLLQSVQPKNRDINNINSGVIRSTLKTALSNDTFDKLERGDPRLVLKYAAETLARLKPWACSVNLAILVYQRAKVSMTNSAE